MAFNKDHAEEYTAEIILDITLKVSGGCMPSAGVIGYGSLFKYPLQIIIWIGCFAASSLGFSPAPFCKFVLKRYS